MTTNDAEACDVPKKPKRSRKVVDRSWFPECGIEERVQINFAEPSAMASAYGNALVEANLDCDVPFLHRIEGNPITLVYAGRDPDDQHTVIRRVDKDVLKSMLVEVGEMVNIPRTSNRGPDDVPSTVITQLLTRTVTDARVPWLRMVVQSPTLAADGWLEGTSYDWDTGILARVEAGGWRRLPEQLTESDLRQARALITDLLRDVKLANPDDRMMLVGKAVGIVARPRFPSVPLQVFKSGNYGPGKTTMAETLFTVCLSDHEWTIVATEDFDGSPAEMNKRISSALTQGKRGLLVDDPKEGVTFNHSDLATLLTAPYADVRQFQRLGPDASVRVYSNQTVTLCANNPVLSARMQVRAAETLYEAGVPDGRKIKWDRPNYPEVVKRGRYDFNWAIRVLVEQARSVLDTEAGRTKWEAWFMGLPNVSVRGGFREWFLYTAVVAELLEYDPNDLMAEQTEYEGADNDPEAERRDWIVQRMRELGAPGEGPFTPGSLMPASDAGRAFAACPFGSDAAIGLYLKNHARGKWGRDQYGHMWRIDIDRARKTAQRREGWTLIAELAGQELF